MGRKVVKIGMRRGTRQPAMLEQSKWEGALVVVECIVGRTGLAGREHLPYFEPHERQE